MELAEEIYFLLYDAYRQTHITRGDTVPRIIKSEHREGDDGRFHGILNCYQLASGKGLRDIMNELGDDLYNEISEGLFDNFLG